ncbi:MAG: hypothetical protein IPJ89_02660 [Candidatus Iainarchaeum archaeon]|uniref:Uncharacterized protein n=1 Tax=Candidatus Iainarchaeum sp. TaxID=3101447 RepID=A0A7T9DKR9_9ARCH|nr:MAG: hypothetical protein IPJ89_02660 [Candidatus Diapherotrites archaeon]
MLPLLTVLFQFGGFFADLDLILKVTGLLLLMSFVRTHVQNAMLATLLTIGLAGFLLFDGWGIFGTGLVVYLAVSFGVVGILVDIFFFGGIKHQNEFRQHETPHASVPYQESRHAEMDPRLESMLRSRGISPEEFAEHAQEFEGHDDADAGHGGHGGEGVNSKEMIENRHKIHKAGQALHGFHPHPPNRAHRGHH